MKTILVIRGSAMGDVAMTAPVLRQVARKYNDVNIVMLTRDFYEPFFFDIPNLTVHNLDLGEQHKGVYGIYKLFSELREKYQIDLIVDLNDKLYSKLLRFYFKGIGVKSVHIDKGRAEKKALTNKCNKKLAQLKTSIQRYADVFATAGLSVDVPSKYTHYERKKPTFIENEQKLIGLAPFAKHKGKILPIETIRELIELAAVEIPDYKFVIFGGGILEKTVANSLTTWYPNTISAIGRVVLEQEIDLIANLELMVSMDSSAMHMSSLVGTPVVSVWGATHPYAGFLGWGQTENNAVCIGLDCQPCSVYGHKPCHRKGEEYKCLKDVSAQQILDKIKTIITDTP